MSAFIVSNTHIATIINYGIDPNLWISYKWEGNWIPLASQSANRLATLLMDENLRAVNARYREQYPPHEFIPVSVMLTTREPMRILKAVHCLQYQCNETEDWPQTEAYAILKAIEEYVVRTLPGYDEVEWSIADCAVRA